MSDTNAPASGGLTTACTNRPRFVTGVMIVATIVLGLLAGIPSLWPEKTHEVAPWLNTLRVDTDPENMLAADEPVRAFHHDAKKRFGLHDIVVLGVVNDTNPDGVFNTETLGDVYALTQYAKTLKGEAIGEKDDPEAGVVRVDLIAPSTVDFIENAGIGTVRFDWLMPSPPKTQEEALAVRDRARRIPFLNGTLISDRTDDALCLYIPLTRKDLAHQVSVRLQKKIDELKGAGGAAAENKYYITGLPVAEDTFGVEMFKQMAISAPLAMLVIFILMWIFFKKITLIIPPMIVAMVTSIMTMALLVISGKTVHIMSSMIPIFIMPIAVLDAIHIISDFFDRYGETRDRRKTVIAVMHELYSPMLFTSLTTTAGFASLALTPIPPVQVFGIFVAIGVMLAWVLTVTFIPAAIMFIPESRLASLASETAHEDEANSPLGRWLPRVGRFTYAKAGLIAVLAVVVMGVSGYGISKIRINDNPTKWFEPAHPIRVADRVLNKHFGGTYMAYLELEAPPVGIDVTSYAQGVATRLANKLDEWKDTEHAQDAVDATTHELTTLAEHAKTPWGLLADTQAYVQNKLDTCPDAEYDAWSEVSDALGVERSAFEVFKQPEVLRWMRDMQDQIETITDDKGAPIVGKSNSLADIVMTVHRDLLGGEQSEYRVPDSPAAVAQCLIQYQSSHRYTDLDHFVLRDSSKPEVDYRKSSLWFQLTSGDNKDMELVTEALESYVKSTPPPDGLTHHWFGLTYINVIWQDKMVSGMLQAFLGSFLVVLFMMIILFRSALWGILSMIPLTLTVGLIYGIIGLVGKDYDMPVAVLSSLSLGLSVDYAIHFLARSRNMRAKYGTWKESVGPVFGEPARAITRNAIVVGMGFLPLLAAPLVPYQTVGFFIAAILLTAGISTLILLPALMRFLEPLLFAETAGKVFTCRCGTCVVTSATLLALIAVNAHQFLTGRATIVTWISLGLIPVFAVACFVASRRKACRVPTVQGEPA
ncbi:MAG: MMPL family transporter [Phycisphaeraceae bacterium]|nr:MAG: MMPL family transporter [Phycisphaeraceae bacterium]